MGKKATAEKDFEITKGVLLRYKGNRPYVVIPDGVTAIGEEAFYSSEVQKVSMPETMRSLEGDTFSFCDSLLSIRVPEGIETLESATFSSCKSLTEIVLPESLKKIDYAAIEDCPALERINIPDGLEVIDEEVFDYLVDKGLIEKSRMKGLRTLSDEEEWE